MRDNDTIILENFYTKILTKEQDETQTPVNNGQNLVAQLQEFLSRGATFASFMYKSKGTGETAIYNVNLNVDYQRVKSEDLETITNYQPENDIEAEAKESLLNPKPRKAAVSSFKSLGKGILYDEKTGAVKIHGWLQNKQTIQAGEPSKPVNSAPLTIAKRALEKKLQLKRLKIREFILSPEHISGLKLKGDVIEFQ